MHSGLLVANIVDMQAVKNAITNIHFQNMCLVCASIVTCEL